jgi:hypothetical protein
MHWSSLVRQPLGLLLGVALLAWPHPGAARAADKASKVTFDTIDGVTLQGSFYQGKKDEPTVLLLHKLGGDSHKDGWDSLAEKLNDKGYSVLSFDFRGHGGSTAVDPAKFGGRAFLWNQKFIRGGAVDARGKPKESINQKDFLPGYLPYLINDIAAAKMYLDGRNDGGDCNSRALVLVGAEDGAALGAVWMASEWSRHTATMNPNFPAVVQKVDPDVAGKDQYCAVWLTMTPTLGKTGIVQGLHSALKLVGRDKKVPMGFLYGDKDDSGKNHAERFVEYIKGSEKENKAYPFTAAQAIKDTKLAGSALLRKELKTEDTVLAYLANVRDKNRPNKWTKIDADRTGYVWTFPTIGRPIVAKDEKSKLLEPMPLGPLGISNP